MDKLEPSSDNTGPRFSYTPISSAEGEIRLLEIEDGSYHDEIVAKLRHVRLSEKPIYLALSYVWGTTISSRKCMLNEVPIAITLNLDQALRRIREDVRRAIKRGYINEWISSGYVEAVHMADGTKKTRLSVWADALSINQSDLGERGAQVRIMRRIYEHAPAIFAWLGHPQNLGNVHAAAAMKDAFCERVLEDWDRLLEGTCNLKDYAKYFPAAIDTDVWQAWEGFTEIFTAEYWNRLWIFQEAATPTEIVFCYGDYSFDEENVRAIKLWVSLFRFTPGFPPPFAQLCNNHSDSSRVISLRMQRHEEEKLYFLILMQQMRGSLCGDPLDRIYAPLALADDVPADSITIDYNYDVNDLYTHIAQSLIRTSAHPLAILGAVYHDSSLESQHNQAPILPSWIPDWRQRYPGQPFSEEEAGAHLYDPLPGTVCIHVQDGTLSVKALVLDTIDIVSLTGIWDEMRSLHTPKDWYTALISYPDASSGLDLAIRKSFVGDLSWDIDQKLQRGGFLESDFFDTAELVSQERYLNYALVEFTCFTRRMAILSKSRVAVLPGAAQIGDKIAAFRGGHALYLIRPSPNQQTYRFIGECYVDGWMDGQIVSEAGEDKVETIRLV